MNGRTAAVTLLAALSACHTCGRGEERARDGAPTELPDQPVSARLPYTDLAISGTRVCALDAARRLACWGDGQTRAVVVPGYENVVLLRGGARIGWLASDHTVHALGTMLDWDTPFEGSEQQGALSDVSDFAFGAWRHACASFLTGGVACWGQSPHGETGRGGEAIAEPMPRIPTPLDVGSFALGASHSCALRADGAVTCWGLNEVGQLGDGAAVVPFDARYRQTPIASHPGRGIADPATPLTPPRSRMVPGAVVDLAGVVEIVAGDHHTCARREVGSVACWGNSESGQLGTAALPRGERPTWAHAGSFSGSARPVDVPEIAGATALAAHEARTCAVVGDGAVTCWGGWRNRQTRLLEIDPRPETCPGLRGVKKLALGSGFACALRDDGQVRCWGDNGNGQLGDGTRELRDLPAP